MAHSTKILTIKDFKFAVTSLHDPTDNVEVGGILDSLQQYDNTYAPPSRF